MYVRMRHMYIRMYVQTSLVPRLTMADDGHLRAELRVGALSLAVGEQRQLPLLAHTSSSTDLAGYFFREEVSFPDLQS